MARRSRIADDEQSAELSASDVPEMVDQHLEALLYYLRASRGFDFTGYKRTGLARRIRKRVQAVGLEDFESYMDYLEVHPQEFTLLFNTVLINVTNFFRDPAAWEYVAQHVLPRFTAAPEHEEQIRVWCAGVSSGEEAYTVAMLLAEALGDSEYARRVKIYATDIDEEALTRALHAVYTEREVVGVPPSFLTNYFELSESTYTVRKSLRRTVIFGRHDLLQDAPISKVELLVCRNTLMYFSAEAQAQILRRFSFALDDRGVLFLGRAEMLFAHSALFAPIDMKHRVFAKVVNANQRDRQMMFLPNGGGTQNSSHVTQRVRVRETAFDHSSVAQFAIDTNSLLGIANERARSLFGITNNDIGRPLQELEFSHRLAGLWGLIEQGRMNRTSTALKAVEWQTSTGDVRYLEIQVIPLLGAGGIFLGLGISFVDITEYRRLQDELGHTNQELETAYEELQSTNEELETTNEELQSTVEELETTTEELQSTNEELETMNEELQSTNEEMDTINQELRQRTGELYETNTFLESILGSLSSGVVVLDRNLQVRVWNRQATELWGLRSDEVIGHHFMNLDIGLPVDQLRTPLRTCLSGETGYVEVTVRATNRRGKENLYRVSCTPLEYNPTNRTGVMLVMQQVDA